MHYKRRKYMKLKARKWTYIFTEKIWNQTMLPCAFSFRTNKVYTRSNIKCYVYFDVKCNERGAKLVGKMYERLKEKKIAFSNVIFLVLIIKYYILANDN